MAEPDKVNAEVFKLFFDFCKHLTTLSTASILILSAFLEKIIKVPQWEALVPVIFVSLIVSMLAALTMMLLLAGYVRTPPKKGTKEADFGVNVFLVSCAAYMFAMVVLVIFSVKNLW